MRIKLTGLRDPNRKISAIKLYRAITGLGLKESKQAVDALAGVAYRWVDDTAMNERVETPIIPQVIEIAPHNEHEIAGEFLYEVLPTPPAGVDPGRVLDFMLVAFAAAESPYDLMLDPAFLALKDSLIGVPNA